MGLRLFWLCPDLLEALAGAVFCDSGGDFERIWQVRILPSKCRLMAVNVISLWKPGAASLACC